MATAEAAFFGRTPGAMATIKTVQQNHRADERGRELLLNAASDLMIELGDHNVSLNAVARKAGVSPPLVTYHFGSKQGLLVALLKRDTSRALSKMQDLLALQISPVVKMRQHIIGIIRTYDRYPYMAGLMNELLRGEADSPSNVVGESFMLPLIEAQRKIVKEGIKQGLFHDVDLDQIYFIIVGTCEYMFTSRVAFHKIMKGKSSEPAFASDFSSTAADILLKGLCRKPG